MYMASEFYIAAENAYRRESLMRGRPVRRSRRQSAVKAARPSLRVRLSHLAHGAA
jgi:hypothetical protein